MPLEQYLPAGVFTVLLVFARIGTAFFIMPGTGETFVPQNARLFLAFATTLVIVPLVGARLPALPDSPAEILFLVFAETVIGLYLGLIARIMLLTLDTAGRIITFSVGLAAAEVFNPALTGQSSIPGLILTSVGILVVLVTNLHHLAIMAVVDSYSLFAPGAALPFGDFADAMARVVSQSFLVAMQLAAPFYVISLFFYVGMGVLAKLMPQVQIFFVALPVQVVLGIVVFAFTINAMVGWFLRYYEGGLIAYLTPA